MQDVRTTTGQRVTITYDPTRNALTFRETDWFADPLRSSAMPAKADIVRPLGSRTIVTLPAHTPRLRRPLKAAARRWRWYAAGGASRSRR